MAPAYGSRKWHSMLDTVQIRMGKPATFYKFFWPAGMHFPALKTVGQEQKGKLCDSPSPCTTGWEQWLMHQDACISDCNALDAGSGSIETSALVQIIPLSAPDKHMACQQAHGNNQRTDADASKQPA